MRYWDDLPTSVSAHSLFPVFTSLSFSSFISMLQDAAIPEYLSENFFFSWGFRNDSTFRSGIQRRFPFLP